MTIDKPAGKDPLAEKAETIERLRENIDETAFNGDQRESTGELSMVDQHPADVSDMTYQRELQETVREMLDREAGQIERAKQRRAAGRYGICEQCGRGIAKERLEALPEATLCIDCQRQLEASRRRP
jgi:RNA polymerase-binding transcription factor DksA